MFPSCSQKGVKGPLFLKPPSVLYDGRPITDPITYRLYAGTKPRPTNAHWPDDGGYEKSFPVQVNQDGLVIVPKELKGVNYIAITSSTRGEESGYSNEIVYSWPQ